MPQKMTVVQCWDDGVTTDAPLIEILRRHGASASFNLNPGLHTAERSKGWVYKGTDVARLGWNEMKELYRGFTIAGHSLSHPHLEAIPVDEARREIVEGRKRLQDFFGQPVRGFAYPFGTYNDQVEALVREAGHVYARTTKNDDAPFPPPNPMAFHPHCHFLSPAFWERYEAARAGGYFYFWGHSYEMIDSGMWAAFEEKIRRISADAMAQWGNLEELFLPVAS